MSSAPSTSARVPRRLNRAPVLVTAASALVLLAGVLAFLIAYDVGGIRNTADVTNPKPTNEPATPVAPKQTTVPLDRTAANVAIRFIDTAVARRNLAASYALVAPEMRQGLSLKEWKTGNIPVQYYPLWARGAGYSPYQIHWSYKNEVMLRILLNPAKGAGVKRQQFWIGIKRTSARAPWKVFYFMPYWFPPRLTGND